MKRAGSTSIAIIALTLMILLGAVLLASYVRRMGLETSSMERVKEAGEISKTGLKVIVWRGLIGVSPTAWMIIHDLYGYGATVDRILGIDVNGTVLYDSNQQSISINRCRAVKALSLQLPKSFIDLNKTYSKIVVHAGGGAVVEAEFRQPLIEEVYPCEIEPPEHRVYIVNVKVWLIDCDGRENACGGCDCIRHEKKCMKNLCNESGPPQGGGEGVPVEPYTVLKLTAEHEITVQGTKYVFQGWMIEYIPGREGGEFYTQNPIELFVDDQYHVKALYKQDDCTQAPHSS